MSMHDTRMATPLSSSGGSSSEILDAESPTPASSSITAGLVQPGEVGGNSLEQLAVPAQQQEELGQADIDMVTEVSNVSVSSGGGGGGGGGGSSNGPTNHQQQQALDQGYAANGQPQQQQQQPTNPNSSNNNNNSSNNNNNNNNNSTSNNNNNGSSSSASGSNVGPMCHPGNPLSGVGVVTGSIPGPSDFPDTKDVIEELCPVCGDKVSGYHYGLLTCESCKGFFKRTVQNKKVYTCVAERQCHIDKTQRKRCPFCRFQKCLEVGMKLEAVRADRMRGGRNKFGPMYKRDRARKLQMMRQRQIALQNLRGSLADPTSYPATVTPFLHIKQEIQIPQVSSLTSSPDSSPSPAAVAAGLVTTQAGAVSSAHQLIAPSTQASLSSATSNSGHLHGGPGAAGAGNASNCSNPLDGSKLWPANSTTPSPKTGFGGSGFPEHHHHHHHHHHGGPGVAGGHSHQAELAAQHGQDAGSASGPADSQREDHALLHSKASPVIQEFVQTIDDREWQTSLYGLLQNQTYNQCEVDLFELMCKVLDQNLFSQVDWARNSVFFKDLKVDDQMKLLQHSWSDMLVLDHVHQRMHNRLPDETLLPNGQKFDLLCLGLLGVPSILEVFRNICVNLSHLKFDLGDYICMKFLLLLNHDVRGLVNRKHVQEGHEQVKQTLLDYTLTCYPHIPNKFSRLLEVFRDIHLVASKGEEHLYAKHCSGSAPTQTLLMEMLHAKRK